MKNNTTKLLVLLAVLLGVFFIVRFTKDDSRSKSFRSTLVELDTAAITTVEIDGPSDSVDLYKEDGKWMANHKPADPNAIKSLFNNLQNIKPARIASRSEDDWKDFQVDDQGTRVRVYEGPEKVLDIILGRFNVEGQRSFYSYVRLAEDEDTYVAGDFMKMSIGHNSAAFRQDDILRLKADSLASIEFNYPDSAFSLYKVDGNWQLEGVRTDSASTAQYMRSLNLVTSRNFEDAAPKEAAGSQVVYKLKGGEQIRISAYDGSVIGSSYNPSEYWQDESVKEKLFKGRSYFLR